MTRGRFVVKQGGPVVGVTARRCARTMGRSTSRGSGCYWS